MSKLKSGVGDPNGLSERCDAKNEHQCTPDKLCCAEPSSPKVAAAFKRLAEAERQGDAECSDCGARYFSGDGHPTLARCFNCSAIYEQENAAQRAMLAGFVGGVLHAAETLDAAGSRARGIAGDVIRGAADGLRKSVAGDRAALDARCVSAVRALVGGAA